MWCSWFETEHSKQSLHVLCLPVHMHLHQCCHRCAQPVTQPVVLCRSKATRSPLAEHVCQVWHPLAWNWHSGRAQHKSLRSFSECNTDLMSLDTAAYSVPDLFSLRSNSMNRTLSVGPQLVPRTLNKKTKHTTCNTDLMLLMC